MFTFFVFTSQLQIYLNPLTLMRDQDRISPYNIKQTNNDNKEKYQLSPYNIKQTNNDNKEKYQLGDYWLIQYKILQTNITRTVWQTVRRITNEILGVKGLSMTR